MASNTASQDTMPWRWAFDLVTRVSSLRGRLRASSKAKRWIRSTPTLVKIDTSRPTSRSEEHTSELQSLMRISYAVFCLKKKKTQTAKIIQNRHKYNIDKRK